MKHQNFLVRAIPLIILLAAFFFVIYFRLYTFLSFESLQQHHAILSNWTEQHFVMASIIFMLVYTCSVAVSVPGAVFLTLAGGFLFGIFFGTLYVVISATLGAIVIFMAMKTALRQWVVKYAGRFIRQMEQGFQKDAFSYLMVLRLVPIFPFWAVNIVPALLGVSPGTFMVTTFFGIIPGSLVYVWVGSGLEFLFQNQAKPNLNIIFAPQIILPLSALALLSLIPIFYKRFYRDKNRSKNLKADICIIGAGAGGLSVAAAASQMGASVILIEHHKMGGDCLNYGCVPSKSLLAAAKSVKECREAVQFGIHANSMEIDFRQVMAHVHKVIGTIAKNDSVDRFTELGVKVIQEKASFLDSRSVIAGNAVIEARRFVLATGSTAMVPPIPGIEKIDYLTNETVFSLKEKPGHLIVLGGGPVGCELSQAFALLGSQVTLLERIKILPHDEQDLVSILREQLVQDGIILHENTTVLSVHSRQSRIFVQIEKEGQLQTLAGTHLLVATGRKAMMQGLNLEVAGIAFSDGGIRVDRRLRSTNKRVYAMGDVTGGFQFTHIASYHAGIIIRNILFRLPTKVNYRAVPWVTYTAPELAHVGLSSEEALKMDPTNKILVCAIDENDRAQAEHATVGSIKVITTAKGKILGATIIGSGAGELLLPWIMAVQEGRMIRDFVNAIVPYPTFSEISKRVAGQFYAPMLFSNRIKMLVRFLSYFG